MTNPLASELETVRDMPWGRERTERCLRIVDAADSFHDESLSFEARNELARSANFGGARDVALVAIGWMLQAHDRDPRLGTDRYLLWTYKWVLESLAALPNVELATIEAAHEDFRRRTHRFGHGQHAAAKLGWMTAWQTGDLARAADLFEVWCDLDRDTLSDCRACDQSEGASWLVEANRHQDALAMLEPLLDGSSACAEEPHRGIAFALGALRATGQAERADALQRRGYSLIANNPAFLPHIGLHLEHLAQHDQLVRAAEIATRHAQWAEDARLPREALAYWRGVLTLASVALDRGVTELSVTLPGARLPVENVHQLWSTARGEALKIAGRYDARNGNRYETGRVEKHATATK
jgi:hypothetical protein